MAKSHVSDSIQPPEKMKPLLALSKQEPLQAAIGLTTEGDGLILLHKKAKPRKVLSMLRTEAGKAKLQLNTSSLRFGRAEVDTDYDAGTVRFFINKAAPGNMRMKLVEVVKRVSYQKVEINVDPSLEQEPDEDTPDQAGDAEHAATPAADAQPALPRSATPPDAGALTKELAALARRIPEVPNTDPAVKAGLVKLATDANADIKANSPAHAADLIAQLREALREALDSTGAGVGRVTPPNGQGAPSSGEPPTASSLSGELGTLARRIAAVSGDDAAMRGSLAKLATGAQDALKADDLAAAAEALGRLREAMAQAGDGASDVTRSAERAKEAAASNARGIGYPKLLLRWREAQSDARAALDRIGKAVLAMPDVQADPRFPRVQTVVDGLSALIPELGGELETLLDRGINAGSDAGIAKDALASAAKYRQAIGGAAKLGSFEQFANQHVGELAVVGTLDGALAEISQNLEKAL